MTVHTADKGSAIRIIEGGNVRLFSSDEDGDSFELLLENVAYAPVSRCNLLALSKQEITGVK